MRRHITLASLAHLDLAPHSIYSRQEMEAARAYQVSRDLRVDNATGTVRNKHGEYSRFSNPADHAPYATESDALEWAFRPLIANSASRKARGFSF